MITPSFNLTATERVLPKLALDFTTASLDPRITFTRTTGASNPATYVNNSGYVTTATDNQPRFDFNPVTLACKGLLIEESRSNICLQSQNFATTWTLTSITVPTSSFASPANDSTAFKYTPDNGSTISNTILRQDFTKAASATTYTLSVYAKQEGYNRVSLYVRDGATSANFATVIVSLVDGSVVTAANAGGTFTNASSTVTNAGNSWYRVTLTYTTSTETSNRVYLSCRDSSATTGDGTKGIAMWGAQLEVGAFATSYIPTTTTALTRNADAATMTGTNFTSWFNASEGTFVSVASIAYLASGSRGPWRCDDGSDTNRIMARNSSGTLDFRVINGGSSIVNLETGNTLTANVVFKHAAAYKTNNYASAFNGANLLTSSSGTVPTVTRFLIGDPTGVLSVAGCTVAKIYYYPQRLTNAEVIAFSKQ